MKRFLAALVLLLCPLAYGDTIYQVTATSIWAAPNASTTQILSLSFLWNDTGDFFRSDIVPGTMQVISGGFLGTYTCLEQSASRVDVSCFNTSNFARTDELDLHKTLQPDLFSTFSMWSCETETCMAAYGLTDPKLGLFWSPAAQSINVVRVPEPSPFAFSLLAMVFMICIVTMRRRRIEPAGISRPRAH